MNKIYIGAVAKKAAVPIKTIRYYEEIGLLTKVERTSSRYRLYSTEVVERLHFIKKAQNLGLRLQDIKEILDLADRGRCPCGHVQQFLNQRLKELREKIKDLQSLEARVGKAIRRGCPNSFRPRGKAICPTIDKEASVRSSKNKTFKGGEYK